MSPLILAAAGIAVAATATLCVNVPAVRRCLACAFYGLGLLVIGAGAAGVAFCVVLWRIVALHALTGSHALLGTAWVGCLALVLATGRPIVRAGLEWFGLSRAYGSLAIVRSLGFNPAVPYLSARHWWRRYIRPSGHLEE